jgi:MFS family permease
MSAPSNAPSIVPPATNSAWHPFRSRIFAVIWTATLVSNIGMWIRDVASGWLMTTLSPSPTMVALVQAALLFPVFLLALPAGALADILDRRKLLVGIQVFLTLVTLAMAAAAATGAMTPGLLLALTFAGGIGAALLQPAFQSIVPELVPKPDLKAAVALNSMGVNVARAIGPALGGVILATAGVALAYLIDALTTLVAVLAFLWWRRDQPRRALPPESFGPAIATGWRYAMGAPALHRILLRAAAFFLFASAYWALLPLIARDLLAGGAPLYGLMLAAIGAGAVAGALLLPRLGRGVASSTLVTLGSLTTALAMAGLALAPPPAIALALLGLAGFSWIAVLTQLGVAVQSNLPDWVRARGLAVYLMVFYGGMAAGSALWGGLAEAMSIRDALLVAAAGGALAALLAATVRLPGGSRDLSPAHAWAAPEVAQAPDPGGGPVLVTLTYQVAPANRRAFQTALAAFSARRRRDGAFGWRLYEDVARPGTFTETFMARNWLDHLRQHDRITTDDAGEQAAFLALAEGPPHITHLIAAHPNDPLPDDPHAKETDHVHG